VLLNINHIIELDFRVDI